MGTTYTELVLRTKQANEAITDGIFIFVITADFQKGWDAMIERARNNGSLLAVKVAIVLDVIKAVVR